MVYMAGDNDLSAAGDADLAEVLREVLGHPLRQGGHQDAFAPLRPRADLGEQVEPVSVGENQIQDDARPLLVRL